MKQCGRCSVKGVLNEFAQRVRSTDGLQSYCRSCQHTTYTEYYRNDHSAFRIALRERTRRQRDVNRRFIAQFLSTHPWSDCGLADSIVLEFDHVRGAKVGNVGAMAYAPVTLAKLQQEIEKCDVRCANCHRKRTARAWRYSLRVRLEGE